DPELGHERLERGEDRVVAAARAPAHLLVGAEVLRRQVPVAVALAQCGPSSCWEGTYDGPEFAVPPRSVTSVAWRGPTRAGRTASLIFCSSSRIFMACRPPPRLGSRSSTSCPRSPGLRRDCRSGHLPWRRSAAPRSSSGASRVHQRLGG